MVEQIEKPRMCGGKYVVNSKTVVKGKDQLLTVELIKSGAILKKNVRLYIVYYNEEIFKQNVRFSIKKGIEKLGMEYIKYNSEFYENGKKYVVLECDLTLELDIGTLLNILSWSTYAYQDEHLLAQFEHVLNDERLYDTVLG